MVDIFRPEVPLDTRTEQARRAVKTFRQMQPQLTAYARALTRRKDVRVELQSRAAAQASTDGKKIYYIPPIGLGEVRQHNRALCDKRSSNLQQLCPACSIREEVMAAIFHEIAHIAFDSFTPVSEDARVDLLKRAIAEGGSFFAKAVEKRVEEAPVWIKNSYQGMIGLVSEFLPLIFNCLEDARVNREMFRARPGTKTMFEAMAFDVFDKGVEQKNERGETVRVAWRDYPTNLQIIVGCYCKLSSYDIKGWFHPQIEQDLSHPALLSILDKMSKIHNPAGVYELSFEVLDELRKLGYCKSKFDPEPEPEPEEEQSEEGPESDEEQSSPDFDESSDDSSEGSSGDADSPDSSPETSASDNQPSEQGDGDSSNESGDAGDEAEQGSGGLDGEEDFADPVHGGGDEPGSGEDPDSTPGGVSRSESDDKAGEESSSSEEGTGSGDEVADSEQDSGEAEGADDQRGASEDTTGDSSDDDDSDSTGSQTPKTQDRGTGSDSDEEPGGGGEDDVSVYPDGGGDSEPQPDGEDGTGEGESASEDSLEGADQREAGSSDGGLVDGSPGPEGELIDGEDDTTDQRSTPEPEEDEEAEPIDTGADQGEGGIEVDEVPPQGTSEEVAPKLADWLGHPELTPSERAQLEDDVRDIQNAIIQGSYFETPSVNVDGVWECKYNDPIVRGKSHTIWSGYNHTSTTSRRASGIDADVDPPESVLAPALMRMRVAFADNQRAQDVRNLKSGKVDARVLGKRVFHDDPRLFKRRFIPGKKDYFVVIGMDVSGSTTGVNLVLMKRSVMAQANLLARMGIRFAVYAHSATSSIYGDGWDLDVYEVKSPDEQWTDKIKNRLREIGPGSGNLDGHALEYLRKVVDTQRATDHIILYYSDGKMPALNYDEELVILQREIRYCRKVGYTLLGVGIRTDSPERHGLDTVQVNEDADIVRVVRHIERRLLGV